MSSSISEVFAAVKEYQSAEAAFYEAWDMGPGELAAAQVRLRSASEALLALEIRRRPLLRRLWERVRP